MDLSQRPRREAPGMLTGLAILERELGSIEYQRHRLGRELGDRRDRLPAETRKLRAQLHELERRRVLVLEKLDEFSEQWAERPAADAGARLRARQAGRAGRSGNA